MSYVVHLHIWEVSSYKKGKACKTISPPHPVDLRSCCELVAAMPMASFYFLIPKSAHQLEYLLISFFLGLAYYPVTSLYLLNSLLTMSSVKQQTDQKINKIKKSAWYLFWLCTRLFHCLFLFSPHIKLVVCSNCKLVVFFLLVCFLCSQH